MSRGEEKVVHYKDPAQTAKTKRWFGFAEVSRELWEEFEEFPSIFVSRSVGLEGVPQHIRDYLAKSKRRPFCKRKKNAWRAFGTEDASVRTAFGMVSRSQA